MQVIAAAAEAEVAAVTSEIVSTDVAAMTVTTIAEDLTIAEMMAATMTVATA